MRHELLIARRQVESVVPVLFDERFIAAYAERIGVEVDSLATEQLPAAQSLSMNWSFSTNQPGIPALAKQFLPERVELVWRQQWQDPQGGDAVGEIGVQLIGRPSSESTGAALLHQEQYDIAYRVDTQTSTALPWPVGPQVERLIDKDLVGWILHTQVEVLQEWTEEQ